MRALQSCSRCDARVSAERTRPTRPAQLSTARRRAGAARSGSLRVRGAAEAFDVGAQTSSEDAAVERACLAWLDSFVIGMELCPFARGARRGTRVVVCRAATAQAALDALWPEVRRLAAAPLDAPATTLFALPGPLAASWDDYMALHARAERENATQAVQLVPFHPDAQYSDAERDAADFATRSPVAIIHLLRAADVRRAEAEWGGGDIVAENADRLRGAGSGALAGMLARFRGMLLDAAVE